MTRSASGAAAVSAEENETRISLAKALWIVDIGDARPTDPVEAQEAFNDVKNEWMLSAIKVQKTLSRLGYDIQSS